MVVVPAATPLTTPEAFTVATLVVLLFQVPPDTASAKVVVPPGQIEVAPVIVPAEAEGVTVTEVVAVDEPQLLVTV